MISSNKEIRTLTARVDEHGNILWQHDKTKIYQGPELLRTLQQAFFATNTAFGYKFEEHYKSTHPDRSEAELPMSLIALAATGVYAALSARESGQRVKQTFDGDKNKAAYDRHIEYLKSIHHDNIGAYHKITSDLLKAVMTHGSNTSDSAPVGNALAVMDLSGY
ncbi:hypothetical protein NP233_g11809 [Leucocoprinus birnbaumii]|uniref:DUF6532 domain-containing protein n=1 Tax=Leucocoprinus birnbaumii TaxID=56174 RepID=A0AAD5VJD5_9AGAR|nr:hypothetical protein NP233_g11809 [Leucocoprinus birnbaumii]